MASAGNRIAELCEEFWQWRMRESPEFATSTGCHTYDHLLDSHKPQAYEKRMVFCEKFLTTVQDCDDSGATAEEKLSLRLLKTEIQTYLDGIKFSPHLYPINTMEGPHVEFERLISFMKFNSKQDYDMYFSRLKAFPTQATEMINLMKQGIAEGRTYHQFSMIGVGDAIQDLVNMKPEDCGIYEPLKKVPESFGTETVSKLQAEGRALIQDQVFPAFQKIKDFIEKEYIPACRPSIGCSSLPDGTAHYEAVLRFHITCDMTAQQVHETGLEEVARIRAEMQKVMEQVGFSGEFKDFLEHLRKDDSFYYPSEEELLNGFKDIVSNKIRPKLPQLFNDIPDNELSVTPAPPSMANSPAAFYLAPSDDGSRPGIFYVNCSDVRSNPKYEMMTLSLHEGEPGHHLQACYSLNQRNLPSLRRFFEDRRYYEAPGRFAMYTAFMEGWGLYCEYLGKEMGLYQDPYSLFGHLSFEIMRACRLVVDTGMHVMGWSKERAVQYMKENSAVSPKHIEIEVNRYITWPGQACAYKIGMRKIQELREKAKTELGSKFDVHEFHAAVLGCGSVPLNILEEVVDQYIQDTKQK
ncbi:uncharacterized protein [Branchiostoma lanceolatum]|uniref:uncharacterized protein n=1 Tax=Branchiostoma lanceolatum TaxID=7740 RepID=UPI003451D0A5